MTYIQVKNHDGGLEKKALRIYYFLSKKQKINPVWFPSHPPIYDGESRLFSGIQSRPKTSQAIPMGEGAKTNQD